jgi:DNA-binding CsgD family transcriptional regulator
MKSSLKQFTKNFDLGVDKIRQISHDFCDHLGITVFAYGRIYPNNEISWLTSSPDQDRFLLESNILDHQTLFPTNALKDGCYLWLCDGQSTEIKKFYKERARLFQMDHGMLLIRSQKDFVEFSCFSGFLTKYPLYNLFMNEQGLFHVFLDHFVEQLDRRSSKLLEQTLPITDFKTNCVDLPSNSNREKIIRACGLNGFLQLSKREKECLSYFGQKTYQEIGSSLELSARTVEHYLESVKNKLGIYSRAELIGAAEKLRIIGG